MPLKERGGELLREFININYKLINSQYFMFKYIYVQIHEFSMQLFLRKELL